MNRALAAGLAILLAPVLAVVAVLVRLTDGRPLLFVHQRAGLDGRPFGLVKFRTMRPPRSPGEPDAARITRVGRLLRRSSLDELPELWNVIRGEMNLVGPRPLPVAYTTEYSPTEARRLEVKPGLTGLVQVRGRNALDVGREVRPRRLVRRASHPCPRPPHPPPDTDRRPSWWRYLPRRARHHAGVQGTGRVESEEVGPGGPLARSPNSATCWPAPSD